ncbi:uncharacterized protein LOC119909601 [Micropterus salmoides]|uniref:uncharacterized protein LOC119909601 n=1 Tax=Micropterus salmoides TaxID=27706 RepID=UPI0018EAB967|nr:uncharacterized protein LOC119909601 [Micropterus salmoides]
MTKGFVSGAMTTVLANSCMDIIQNIAEAILDVVMPQVYRYMRIYGSFSPTVLGLTEDRIHACLRDSIELALANCLRIKVENFLATKVFSQLLLRHISKTINSVLALSTQTPILESRLPVFFVSGCVTSITDLKDMVYEIVTILTGALEGRGQSSQIALCEPSGKVEFPIFCLTPRGDLKKIVKTYIIRMVKVLKNGAQMPHCEISSSNHRDICIRVGTNIHILPVEHSESHGQQSATSSSPSSGVDAIPGAVPDNDTTDSHSESCPSSVTIIGAAEDHSFSHLGPNEIDSIKNIADEIVHAFLGEDLQGAAQACKCQKAVHSEQEVVDIDKIRKLTDRIFNVVMSGRDYQIPSMPAGTRICKTVTCRKLRRGNFPNPSIIARALYMRTEEVVTRCAVQVHLWSELRQEGSDCPSPLTFDELSDDPDFVLVPSHAAGDHKEVVFLNPPSHCNSSMSSQDSNATYDAIPKPPEPTQSQLHGDIVHISLLSLLVGEMLTVIGIKNSEIIFEVIKKLIKQLQDVDPKVYNHFHASLMGRSYKDIYQNAITDLLLEFGSIQVMQEAVRSGDPNFEEAISRELRKQLRIPTSPVSRGKAAEKMFGFFKTLKRLCCRKTSKKSGKTTTVLSLTSDQDDSKLLDHLSTEEPLKGQTVQSESISIARTLCRLFITCFSPKSQ